MRCKVFMSVTMKNAIFWDVTPCGSCKNERFRRTYCIRQKADKNRRAGNKLVVTNNRSILQRIFIRGMLRLLATSNVSNSPILVTLMMEAIRSSETSALTRPTWRNIPEDSILHGKLTLKYIFFHLQFTTQLSRSLVGSTCLGPYVLIM
jgi:hypothetical protein